MKHDLKAIAKAVWPPFATWLAAVLVVAFGGRQPGVICATPVAWWLALWVGLLYSAHTAGPTRALRLMGAAIAGGVFGLLQGVLFAAVVPFMGDIKPGEEQKAVTITIVMLVVGTVVCALLSFAIAAAKERHRVKAG